MPPDPVITNRRLTTRSILRLTQNKSPRKGGKSWTPACSATIRNPEGTPLPNGVVQPAGYFAARPPTRPNMMQALST